MSRFFATGSDSESETSSSDESLPPRQVVSAKTFEFSDEEEESTRRVVRSAKDKRFDELQNIIKQLKNHKKIKDFSNVLSDFEQLVKAFDKAKKVVEKEGIPRFYIRTITELEDFANECWEDREARKAMSKSNAKGLTTMRQKIRKYNRDFESEVTSYRENPDLGDEVEEVEEREMSESESDDGGMGADYFKKKPTPTKPDVASKFLKGGDEDDEDESDDSMDWGSDSDSETSSSDEEAKYGGNLAEKFLKKTTGDTEKISKEKVAKRAKRPKKQEVDEGSQEEDTWQEVKGGVPTEKPRMFSKDAEINHELVIKKLHEIVSARGKKGTDRQDQIEMLIELRGIADTHNLGSPMDVKILFAIVAAIYDYNPNIATCMKQELWEKCLNYVTELLEVLFNNQDIFTGEHVSDDAESFVGDPPFRVRGCMLTLVERMDEEYIKMLQACDAHSTEYVERLKDERAVCKIIERVQEYLEGRATTEEICRIYLKRVEHTYYKICRSAALPQPPPPENSESDDKPPENPVVKTAKEVDEENRVLMDKLCKYIYSKDNTDRMRTRAILYHIYHHGLHDRWFEARDLMLMSHLQDTIQHSDVPTQIMYNRAMVQLGLCAFRQGMIKDAHNCLVDIQSGGRAKELLAQGLLLQRQHERTAEQEKIEKRRQMPYHMHINLELLECVYLVSAMLMEIPYMAAHEFDARRRMISKNFHHVLRVSERQPLVGPPESMREHVVAASKAMKRGNWKACKDFIINEKMNAKVWDLFIEKDRVRDMIVEKIKEESLRTYLFTYSAVYDSLSLHILSNMFEMEKATCHSTISKMIINEELMASLDEPTQTVVMHRTEPTRLQSLALQLSEKVSSLVENNERIMEVKQGGGFFFQKQGNQGGYRRGDREDGDGFRGRREYRGGYRGGDRQGGYGDRRQGDRGGGGGGYRGSYQNRQGGDYKDDYRGGGRRPPRQQSRY